MLNWVYCPKMTLSYENIYSHYKTQNEQKCKSFHYKNWKLLAPPFLPGVIYALPSPQVSFEWRWKRSSRYWFCFFSVPTKPARPLTQTDQHALIFWWEVPSMCHHWTAFCLISSMCNTTGLPLSQSFFDVLWLKWYFEEMYYRFLPEI